ncbi:MAG: hypothetical protein U0228_11480 [Myxococcaceae bacterium]
MRSLRILSLGCLLTGAISCRDPGLANASADLQVRPERLFLGEVWVGYRASQPLELQNAGRQRIEVTLSVDAPFEIAPSASLGGGVSQQLDVGLTATQPGLVRGTVSVTWGGNTREVSVEATALVPPSCPARDCRASTFDPVSGSCVETVLDDGAACGAENACLTGGRCVRGECIGEARSCDDRDACTTDACEPSAGCVHQPVVCPASLDPCQAATCDATAGCGFAPAVDGASCGSNDCQTAHVCINAQCVTRPAPDGSECAAPTMCQGPGVCRSQVCERPTPGVLSPKWTYTPPPDHHLTFLGHVDDDGNVYVTEFYLGYWHSTPVPVRNPSPQRKPGGTAEDTAGIALPTLPITELISFTPSGVERFRVQVTTDCESCTNGHAYAIDSANHRLFFTANGTTQARSTDDGEMLWFTRPTAGLPAYDLLTDGGAAFYASPPLLIGNDAVGIPVIEGASDHHSYVQVFDRASGTFRWQFHRKGHLYGSGVTGAGELWTSSADCWAPVGELARVSPTGMPLQTQWISGFLPATYGGADSFGTQSGQLTSLDENFNALPLGTLLGVSPNTQVFTSSTVPIPRGPDERLITWDSRFASLAAFSQSPTKPQPPAFDRHFAYSGVRGYPDVEALAGGGVAWTSVSATQGWIGAVDGLGNELFQCQLAALQSPTAISHSRAFVQAGNTLVGYDVPGLEPARFGWISKGGSLGRGGPAR